MIQVHTTIIDWRRKKVCSEIIIIERSNLLLTVVELESLCRILHFYADFADSITLIKTSVAEY